MHTRFGLPVVAVLAALVVAGCQSQSSSGVTASQPPTPTEDRPTSDSATGTNGQQPARPDEPALAPSKPAGTTEASAAADAPDAAREALETPEAGEPEPRLPRYLEVLERFDHRARATVHVRLVPPANLRIETDNVRRLRITRAELPLTRRRSTVLHLDGQGIEWRLSSEAVEFERSPNGVWTAVKSRKSGR